MSADNGHAVSRLDQKEDQWGIFYYYASNDSEIVYTFEGALAVYENPVHAILAAHKVERDNPTEYGVAVRPHVLEDTHNYFQYNTNEIAKPLREAWRDR